MDFYFLKHTQRKMRERERQTDIQKGKKFIIDWFNHPTTLQKIEKKASTEIAETIKNKTSRIEINTFDLKDWNGLPEKFKDKFPFHWIYDKETRDIYVWTTHLSWTLWTIKYYIAKLFKDNTFKYVSSRKSINLEHTTAHEATHHIDHLNWEDHRLHQYYPTPQNMFSDERLYELPTYMWSDPLLIQVKRRMYENLKFIFKKLDRYYAIWYLQQPDELYARIMEMRMYLWLSPWDSFTSEHLKKIKKNMKNQGIQNLLMLIETPKQQNLFIEYIDRLP